MAKIPPNKVTIDNLRKENARLGAEIARLSKLTTSQVQESSTTNRNVHRILRNTTAVVSMLLAGVLLVAGNFFFWTGNTIVSQDRFVAATAPVIQDQQVQQSIALYATNQLFNTVNVQHYVSQALPPGADFLAPQLTNQIRNNTQTTLQKALATPKFQQVWNSIVANQHQRIIQFAEKYEGNGTISINEIFTQLTSKLSNTKLAFLAGRQLPQNIGSIEVINASWLPFLHTLIVNIGAWRALSLLGLIVFTTIAIWLSGNRRRTIYLLGFFAVLGLLISLVMLRGMRERIIDKVNPDYSAGVANAIHIMTQGLVKQTFTIVALLIILSVIAWISGASPGALRTKRYFRTIITEKFHHVLFGNENVVTSWIGAHRSLLEWGTLTLIILLMLILRLTFTTLTVLVVLLIIIVTGIEIASNRTRQKT